ncbi:MAG: RNA polymerase sigma factor [Bacillota bacterium]
MRIKDNLYGPDSQENNLSFEQLIAGNEGKILNLIYGMTGDYHLAQDLTQETFIKAFRSKSTFNGKSKFSTWLYRIAVNVTIDYQRKSSVRRENPTEDATSGLPDGGASENPDQACQKNAVKEILFSSIARLPEQQREVFILREINGCSTKEVAEIMGCSQELIKWRLHKARSTLRKSLQTGTRYRNIGTYILNSTGLE